MNKNTIKRYIQNQDLEDKIKDQRSLKEYKDRLRVSNSGKGNWQTMVAASVKPYRLHVKYPF